MTEQIRYVDAWPKADELAKDLHVTNEGSSPLLLEIIAGVFVPIPAGHKFTVRAFGGAA